MRRGFRHCVQVLVLAAACGAPLAQAQLFGDDQARQAILDLRQRFDQAVTAQNRLVEENASLRRSMLDLQGQIETLRSELASARGEREQLTRDLQQLRSELAQACAALGAQVHYPDLVFCTDNGAMIAHAGALRLAAGQHDDTTIAVRPRWDMASLPPLEPAAAA